jgi:hypothetical protein
MGDGDARRRSTEGNVAQDEAMSVLRLAGCQDPRADTLRQGRAETPKMGNLLGQALGPAWAGLEHMPQRAAAQKPWRCRGVRRFSSVSGSLLIQPRATRIL